MRNRILTCAGVLAILVQVTAAQTPGQRATDTSNKKAGAPKKWRTPWGDPNLQGSWSNATTTPLERPAKYAGRPTAELRSSSRLIVRL